MAFNGLSVKYLGRDKDGRSGLLGTLFELTTIHLVLCIGLSLLSAEAGTLIQAYNIASLVMTIAIGIERADKQKKTTLKGKPIGHLASAPPQQETVE